MTAADIQNYLATYTGNNVGAIENSMATLTVKSILADYEFWKAANPEQTERYDEPALKRRFLLNFSTNLIDAGIISSMEGSITELISRTTGTLATLHTLLEDKADMQLSTDRLTSTTLVQTQIQFIHQVSTGAQQIADLLRNKISLLATSAKLAKTAADAVENMNVIFGKLLDAREITAYTNDLKVAQTAYEAASKRLSTLADSADRLYNTALRRDSAIRMLINQANNPGQPRFPGDEERQGYDPAELIQETTF